jgi:putative tricarboxylic transport membrane protein
VRADSVAALLIAVLGVWVLWQATSLREGPGYAAVGPRVFPMVVGVGMMVSGLALLWSSWRVGSAQDSEATPAADWATLLGMAAALAGYIVLYRPLGFIAASTVFLVAGAWILGSRSPLRDVLAGVLVSVGTFVLFTRLLGLELPVGPLG